MNFFKNGPPRNSNPPPPKYSGPPLPVNHDRSLEGEPKRFDTDSILAKFCSRKKTQNGEPRANCSARFSIMNLISGLSSLFQFSSFH